MDQFDRAQALEEKEREARIAFQRSKQSTVSLSHCVDCGEAIPKERQALGGVCRCVWCQKEYELRKRRGL